MAAKKRKVTKETAIQLQEMHTQHLMEYGIDLQTRTVKLIGDIDEDKFDLLDGQLSTLESINHGPITVKICSYGGSTHHALAIVARIRNSPCDIVTEGHGAIMSAATLILSSGDIRRMSAYSVVMHHEAAYEVAGAHSAVQNVVKQVEREEKMWARIMSQFTKKSVEFWYNSGKGGIDLYLTADESLEHGICDEIF